MKDLKLTCGVWIQENWAVPAGPSDVLSMFLEEIGAHKK